MLRDSTHAALRTAAIEHLKRFGGFVETDWSATAIHEEYDDETGVTMVSISLINGKGNRLWLDCGVIEYPEATSPPSFPYMNIVGGEILNYL